MENQQQFEKNLNFFASGNPRHAIRAGEVDPAAPIDYDAEKWFQGLPLNHQDVLYIFGIDSGQAYEAAKEWLGGNPCRHIVFLEDDIRRIRRFLEEKNAEDLLLNPRSHIFAFSEISEEDPLLDLLAWSFTQQQIFFAPLPHYRDRRSAECRMLEQLILYESAHKNEIIDEYMKYGVVFYRNFYHNLMQLHNCYSGNKLFGQFQNVPAIICGAGPSLKKNIHLLKDLKERALILAGGSSLNALCKEGILPHFGAGIDPNPTQYYRFMGHSVKNIPFFFRPRMNYKAFRSLTGPRLYINGAGGYDTAEWFERELGIEGSIPDEGHNVVNFCTAIASELGCSPIIFVGMDLAYSDLKSYAEGVVDDPSVTEEQLTQTGLFETSAVVRKDIYGDKVYTMWKWIAESVWLSDFAEKYPDLTIINATEGGIGFEGIPNEPLTDVIKKHLQKEYPFDSDIPSKIEQAAMPHVSCERVLASVHKLRKSLERCVEAFDVLIEEGNRIQKLVEVGDIPETMQTGLQALTETELAEEPAYEAVLEIFNTMFSHIKQRDYQSAKLERDERKRKIKHLELTDEKYLFLRQVAEANLILIREALNS